MLSRQALARSVRAAAPTRAIVNQSRFYAAATDNVKPPVAVFGLDGTYATALVRLSLLSCRVHTPWRL
jgi:F-type H+-transporting ATPase subunit O